MQLPPGYAMLFWQLLTSKWSKLSHVRILHIVRSMWPQELLLQDSEMQRWEKEGQTGIQYNFLFTRQKGCKNKCLVFVCVISTECITGSAGFHLLSTPSAKGRAAGSANQCLENSKLLFFLNKKFRSNQKGSLKMKICFIIRNIILNNLNKILSGQV